MKSFIVANWKMNPQNLAEAMWLFNTVKNGLKNIKNTEVVICPPFLYIPEIRNTKYKIKIGAQDCFWEEKGAFTGEVSPKMLKNLDCQYVILGHSERRKYLGETDEMVNKKLKAALKENLTPILCIASLSQIKKDLKKISGNDFKKIIIAYEPIFAIGTGEPCPLKKAEEMRGSIKKTNNDLTILYGGSVNSKNAKDYIKKAGFQGLLIGGASLNQQELLKIIESID